MTRRSGPKAAPENTATTREFSPDDTASVPPLASCKWRALIVLGRRVHRLERRVDALARRVDRHLESCDGGAL